MRPAALLLALALLSAPPGIGHAVELIAHPSVTLSADDVRDIFLGEKQLADGTKLVPVDNAAVQREFVAKVLRIEIPKYTSLWIKKAFREGLVAPAMKGNDAEVAAFVRATPGAVGYVNVAPAGARVIAKY
jgi:hypothetical protein